MQLKYLLMLIEPFNYEKYSIYVYYIYIYINLPFLYIV